MWVLDHWSWSLFGASCTQSCEIPMTSEFGISLKCKLSLGHTWRWRQQQLPLHIFDSIMHCWDEQNMKWLFSYSCDFPVWFSMLSQRPTCILPLVSYVCQSPSTIILPVWSVDSDLFRGLVMQALLTYWHQQGCMLDRYKYFLRCCILDVKEWYHSGSQWKIIQCHWPQEL